MPDLGRLWRSEFALPDTFWSWTFFGGLAVKAASSALFVLLIDTDRTVLTLIAGYGPSVPYNVVVTMGLWRSAKHYQGNDAGLIWPA